MTNRIRVSLSAGNFTRGTPYDRHLSGNFGSQALLRLYILS